QCREASENVGHQLYRHAFRVVDPGRVRGAVGEDIVRYRQAVLAERQTLLAISNHFVVLGGKPLKDLVSGNRGDPAFRDVDCKAARASAAADSRVAFSVIDPVVFYPGDECPAFDVMADQLPAEQGAGYCQAPRAIDVQRVLKVTLIRVSV